MANSLIKYCIQHYDELIITAVRMTKNYEDAEDIMQNVVLTLCKREQELENVENCGGFIAVCIRRAVISLFRHKSHEQVTDPYFLESFRESTETKGVNDCESAYEYMEWLASLESHLEGYYEEMKHAFIAHYVDGVPLNELGEKLGVSAKALSGRFARMRKTLKNNSQSLFNQLNILLLL